MRWAGYVARIGERRGAYKALEGKPGGKKPFGRTKRKWRIVLRWISRRRDGEAWIGLIWLKIETWGGHL
jgi:hypothetical protein